MGFKKMLAAVGVTAGSIVAATAAEGDVAANTIAMPQGVDIPPIPWYNKRSR